MPEKEELDSELKALFDIIEESGENGTDLGEIFDKLEKDSRDTETLLGVMTNLDVLREMDYIHRKIVEEERTERGVTTAIKWFVVGKGDSVKEGTFLFYP